MCCRLDAFGTRKPAARDVSKDPRRRHNHCPGCLRRQSGKVFGGARCFLAATPSRCSNMLPWRCKAQDRLHSARAFALEIYIISSTIPERCTKKFIQHEISSSWFPTSSSSTISSISSFSPSRQLSPLFTPAEALKSLAFNSATDYNISWGSGGATHVPKWMPCRGEIESDGSSASKMPGSPADSCRGAAKFRRPMKTAPPVCLTSFQPSPELQLPKFLAEAKVGRVNPPFLRKLGP